ncbi:MAG: phosphoribosylanthranilate isomerase [Gammaproteobacteria bacterium]|nr:phosphoribosylanthranilate isomerase [Gammaproteobacteria bacterium]
MNKNATPTRTRIKICGLKTAQDALLVSNCGADSIGLVFHQNSPRFVEIDIAEKIRQQIPAFVTVTALFMDDSSALIKQVIEQVKPDCLQFHGKETAKFCESWCLPYIKAIPMGSISDANDFAQAYPSAQGFLLDSNVTGRQGGSGDTFDWSKIPSTFQYPLILAGGLNPQNVAEAISQVHPWAVDVSSGVEQLKAVKDPDLIRLFCKEVFRADCRQ